MAYVSEKDKASFKDYYFILQIHPEADYAMVDAAYWHLARRYNQAALADSSARARLDELNEAYSVLGAPVKRDEYNRIRAKVLGAGALPAAQAPPPPAPLAVMERQRPRPRAVQDSPSAPSPELDGQLASMPRNRTWVGFTILQVVGGALVMLTLGTAAIGTWASPMLVSILIAGGIALLVAPFVLRLPRLLRRSASSPAGSLPESTVQSLNQVDPLGSISAEDLRAQMTVLRDRLRNEGPQAPSAATPTQQTPPGA